VVGQPVELGRVVMLAPERSFTVPPIDQRSEAIFGDALHFLGYNLEMAPETLRITLHWQALQRMGVAYSMFVHLFDPATEALASQADVMPHGFTYPTVWWEAEEVVSDKIAVSLEGVAPGTYRLAVGVYDFETGERLPVRDAAGELQPLDRLVLPQEIQR
jgi:hypothetical protein